MEKRDSQYWDKCWLVESEESMEGHSTITVTQQHRRCNNAVFTDSSTNAARSSLLNTKVYLYTYSTDLYLPSRYLTNYAPPSPLCLPLTIWSREGRMKLEKREYLKKLLQRQLHLRFPSLWNFQLLGYRRPFSWLNSYRSTKTDKIKLKETQRNHYAET